MLPLRVIRSGLLLAGVLATCGLGLSAAESGFTATLSSEEKKEAGLDGLAPAELSVVDELVASDLARARQSGSPSLPGTLADRAPADRVKAAGLDRLTPAQLDRLDGLIAAAAYVRPAPRERPRLGLKDREILTEQGRLRLHGGMSFTVGGGSGGSFYGTSAWASYYDPQTGLGIGFSYSTFKGDGPIGYYPNSYYPGFYSAAPRSTAFTPMDYAAEPTAVFARSGLGDIDAGSRPFRGDGGSFRGGGHRH